MINIKHINYLKIKNKKKYKICYIKNIIIIKKSNNKFISESIKDCYYILLY